MKNSNNLPWKCVFSRLFVVRFIKRRRKNEPNLSYSFCLCWRFDAVRSPVIAQLIIDLFNKLLSPKKYSKNTKNIHALLIFYIFGRILWTHPARKQQNWHVTQFSSTKCHAAFFFFFSHTRKRVPWRFYDSATLFNIRISHTYHSIERHIGAPNTGLTSDTCAVHCLFCSHTIVAIDFNDAKWYQHS